jgi:uncharacterized protein (TIGR02145 family)
MRQRLRFAETKATVALPVNGKQSNVMALSKQKLIKKSMLWLVPLFIFTSVALKAQSPQKINFQSIVRNTSGAIVSNKSVSFKITILSGSISGTPVYSEAHLKTTDAIGLVSLQIGTGTVSSGVFSSIDWGNTLHFIKLEADFTGGNTYVTLGIQELMSVPYALYAVKTDTSVLNLSGRFSGKVNVTDTSSMLAPYLRRVDANGSVETDPVFNSSIAKGITGTDTAYWNKKINTTDTSAMLSNYRTALNLKAPLASPTFTGTVGGITKAMVVGLENVENTSDLSKQVSSATQAALDTKFNKADFPSGSSANEILYWNGTNWISLAPGTTGQALIMSSTGLSWGCIITNTVAAPSTIPTPFATALLTPITIATTGATGIGSASGLPSGVTAAWSGNVITISGTPSAAGTFNYSIPLTGGCGTASATGTITVNPAPVCPSATITYNGYTYNTMEIGTQCWMAENLRTRKYSDGTDIRFDASGGVGGRDAGETWSSFTYGAHTIYEHDSTPTTGNLAIYGYLYNWYAAKGISTPLSTDYKNICPVGWHVPTNTQWRTLRDYLSPNAGNKLKSTENYWTPNTGNDNTSSFAARPGGARFSSNGQFFRKNTAGHFWSSTLLSTIFTGTSGAFTYTLFESDSGLAENNWPDFTTGASIRCLKD